MLPFVLDIFQSLIHEQYLKQPPDIQLHLQRSENYIGLFLDENSIDWLTEAMSFISKKTETELGKFTLSLNA